MLELKLIIQKIGQKKTFQTQKPTMKNVYRVNKMKGKNVLWIPGTDHAGISTQSVVEKRLMKEKINKYDLGREKFVEKIMDFSKNSQFTIHKQMVKKFQLQLLHLLFFYFFFITYILFVGKIRGELGLFQLFLYIRFKSKYCCGGSFCSII